MQAQTYNKEGKTAGKIELPESVFGQSWNADLVHEVVLAMRGNARAGTAHTKHRGEVAGSGKKPWRQKGTGRARAGSKRSPIWRGGGIVHGPRTEKDYSRKINRKAGAKALAVALSQKLRDEEVLFLDALAFAAPKTKEAKAVLMNLAGIKGYETLATKRRNTALLVLAGRNEPAEKSFRNFGNVFVLQAKDLNPVELMTYKYVILADAEPAVAELAKRMQAARSAASAATTADASSAKKTVKKGIKKTNAA